MKKNLLAKVLSCVLAATMVLGLAACGDTKQEESKTPDSSPVAGSETAGSEVEEREEVEIVYYNWAHIETQGTEAGKESVINAVNEYLKEKLNTTVDFHLYNNTDYQANMGTIFNSGTYMDLVTSGTGTFNFAANASRNAYLALNDYVDEYLPGTKAQLPEAAWDAFSINGNIYAVPTVKDLPYNWGFVANQTLLDDLGVTVPEYDTAWDLLPMLYEIKEKRDAKYPDKAKNPIMSATWMYLEAWEYFEGFVGGLNSTLAGANIPGLDGFEGYGEGETVFCPYMTDEFRQIAHEQRKLVEEGLAPVDRKGFDQDKVIYQQGDLIGSLGIGFVEYDEDTTMPYYKAKLYKAANSYMSTNTAGNCGTSVPAISEHPERALEVLEMFNNDEYLATTLRFGAEGEGWTDTDNDGVIELTEANSDSSKRFWYQWYGYQLASLQTTKAVPGSSPNFGELIYELNNTASATDNMGFLADVTNIQNEIAACNAVKDEFRSVLLEGQVEDVDGTVDAFVQKLKDNGIQTIIDEVQKQLDEWRAANL